MIPPSPKPSSKLPSAFSRANAKQSAILVSFNVANPPTTILLSACTTTEYGTENVVSKSKTNLPSKLKVLSKLPSILYLAIPLV